MASDDKERAIAQVYARSILDLAQEAGEVETVADELQELIDYAEKQEEFGSFLTNPLTEPARRRGSLETLFRGRMSDLTLDALQVINRKGRMELLPAIVQAYKDERRKREGWVEVEVVSAVPLTDALRERLRQAVDRRTGRKSEIKEVVDPSILGGLVVRMEDEKIDTSVARELAVLSERLSRRASAEILSGKDYKDYTAA